MYTLYYCTECNKEFVYTRKNIEHHGLDSPPYEEIECCPFCDSTSFINSIECCVCGNTIKCDFVKLKTGEYICDDCYTTGSVGD